MNSKKDIIAIVGMGYVGLPLAVELSKKTNVIGFDIDKIRVNSLLKGIDVTEGDKKYKFPDKENSKIHYVFKRFQSEYLHENIFRYHRGDVKKVMEEWLSGLALNFDYYYYDIIEESKKMHEVESFEEEIEELIKDNWWQHLANELFYLLDQQ